MSLTSRHANFYEKDLRDKN